MPKTPWEIFDKNKFSQVRFVAEIPRYSVAPVVRRQTVGEHCFLVARYAMLLAERLQIPTGPRIMILEYALKHDDDEAITGDIPTPIKAQLGYESKDRMKEERPMVYYFVKVCDRLEAVKYMHHEHTMGNRFMMHLINGAVTRFFDSVEQLQVYFDQDIMKILCELEGIEDAVRGSKGSAAYDQREEGVRPSDGPRDWEDFDDLMRILGIQKQRPN